MVAGIGVMIGLYIIVRMLQLLSRKGEDYHTAGLVVCRVAGVIVMVVTAFTIIDIITTSAATTEQLQQLQQLPY